MRLRLFLLPNFPGATFIQGGTFIPDSRVTKYHIKKSRQLPFFHVLPIPDGNRDRQGPQELLGHDHVISMIDEKV